MGDNGEGTEGDTPHTSEGQDCQDWEATRGDIDKEVSTSATVPRNLKEELADIDQSDEVEKADRLQDIHPDGNKPEAVFPETSPKSTGLRSRFKGKGRGNQRPADETKTEDKGEKGAPIREDKRRNPSRVVTCIYACCCVAPVE